ncbi:MAG TPA: hypothetical protein VK308_01935 [Pyrinomonadaceae bacterium]|nr:hypothetical protein [Pyrinomonadaceae bacterium]
MKNKITKTSFSAAILLSLLVIISDADAQTNRRKKTTKPIATPVQSVSTDISRTDRYLDGNQIVLGELPQRTETTNEVVPPPPDVRNEENNAELDSRIKELNARIKSLESSKRNEYDEKQKRLLLNLDILSRAESRAESLRKQLFEMVEKEATVRTRLEQISFDARPEMIERSTAFVGSLRPEEIRDQRRKSLDAEKRNLESLLTQIQTSRSSLEENVQKADFLVEKVRFKLDKDIDAALAEEKDNQ